MTRTSSLNMSVDVGDLLGTVGNDFMSGAPLPISRTRSQEKLDQACADLGYQVKLPASHLM